jgi:C4-dicarboxylate-specific signal transduction histidine kinase
MIQKLLKYEQMKNRLVLMFLFGVIVIVMGISWFHYANTKELLRQKVNHNLLAVGRNPSFILDDHLQNLAYNDQNISRQEDEATIKKLSKYNENAGTDYVYTLIKKGESIYFTSSSAKEEDYKNGDVSYFMDKYDEATPLLHKVFQTHKITFEESTDRWGSFRSVFIPMQTAEGKWFVYGVDVDTYLLHQRVQEELEEVLIGNIVLIIFAFILMIYYKRFARQELHNISEIEGALKKQIEEKTHELQTLNEQLEHRVAQEVEKNREKELLLQEQQRFAIMGELISMIAHQWRQPLNAISAATQVLKMKMRLNKLDNETIITVTDNIVSYTQHLSNTIDDFRSFTQKAKHKERVTYSEIIESVMGIMGASLKSKAITVELDLESDVVFKTLTSELKQVLLNLLKNSEDVLVDKGVANPRITIQTRGTLLCVSDNGGGIEECVQETLFDPYVSTKKEKNGTGLGLYMSKIIIQEHCGGSLRVENTQEGAKFTIDLASEVVDEKN